MAPKKQIEEKKEDPNAIWAHAGSIEDTRMWEDRKSELLFMRDLFDTKLPVGDQKEQIDDYFNLLEQAIDNKDTSLQNDKFPESFSDIDIHGEVDHPPEQYTYFSADLFKQQASKEPSGQRGSLETKGEYKSITEEVANPSDVDSQESVPDVSKDDGDLSCMDVSYESHDPDDWLGKPNSTGW
jgi:hypothetical protein